jgi:hypothetical protein
MKKILVIFMLVSVVCYSQTIQKVDIYDCNINKTNQTVDVLAGERVRLYRTAGVSDFIYTAGIGNYFHAKLGKMGYPTTDLPVLQSLNKENIGNRPDKQYDVGSTVGYVSVNSTGAATYTIPIKVLQGTNGVTPQISLMYNSNTGNGIAGWGWNINGISAISRIGKDKYHDGVYDKIQFTSVDKLTLDGNRLETVYGTEGNADAVYATEVGNTVRIYPHAVSSTGYTWFEVKGNDGSVVEFGNSSTSRLATEKGILNWYVSKVTDANGNQVFYDYGMDFGEVFIKTISYTGNAGAGLNPYAKVEFIYNKRPDNNSIYMDGLELNQSVILTEIDVKYESQGSSQDIHKYTLDYTVNDINNNFYSQLYRIIEYGQTIGSRYNSTIFEYTNIPPNEKRAALNVPTTVGSDWKNTLELFGDFNGDKISDRLQIVCNEPNNRADWYMQFGKFYGKNEEGSIIPNSDYKRQNDYTFIDPPGGTYQFCTVGRQISFERILLDQIQIVDINHDGYDDVIIPYLMGHFRYFGDIPEDAERYDSLKIRIDTSDGSKLNKAAEFTAIDKRLFRYSADWCNHELSHAILHENLIVGDFDGDGNQELIIHAVDFDMWTTYMYCQDVYEQEHYHNFYYADLSTVSGNGKGYINPNPSVTRVFQSREDDQVQDVNAQAIPINYNNNTKTDLMLITDNANDYGYYELNTSVTPIRLDKINSNKMDEFHADFKYFTGDFNGDGLTDIFYYRKVDGENLWRVRYGVDGDFSGEYSIPNFNFCEPFIDQLNFKNWLYIIDLNGDGKSDLLWYTYENQLSERVMHYHTFTSYGMQNFKYVDYTFTKEEWILSENYVRDFGQNGGKRMSSRKLAIIDFNGDGNSDLYNIIYDYTYVPEVPPDSRNPFGFPEYFKVGDLKAKCILTLNFEDNDLHLKNIYDGFNNRTNINYEPLSKGTYTSPNVANPYLKGTSAVYPVMDIGGGGYVATSINKYSADDFDNPKQTVKYTYEGGLTHLEGKGFLGFTKMTQIIPDLDNSDVTKIISENSLDLTKYVMLPIKNQTWINNTLINESIISNDFIWLNTSHTRYFVYQNQIDQIDYLNDTKSRTINIVDYWGNIFTTITKLGDPATPKMTISTNNYYFNDYGNATNKEIGYWCTNNKLFSTYVTQHHSDDSGPIYSREKVFSYFNHKLDKVTTDPYLSGKVEVSFNYDKLGNVIKTTAHQTADPSLPDRFIMPPKKRTIE